MCNCNNAIQLKIRERNPFHCVYHLEKHEFCAFCICPQCETMADNIRKRIIASPGLRKEMVKDPILNSFLISEERAASETSTDSKVTWITISYKEMPIEDLINANSALFKLKFITKYAYVYEQRSKTPDKFHGVHVHALVWSKSPAWKVKQWFAQKLMSPKYKAIASNKFIDAKQCPQAYIDDKMEYMTGAKEGQDKQDKQNIDVIFRQKYELKKIYKNF